MRAFGADLTVVPSVGGRIAPELFVRMRHEVDRIVERDDAYWTDQLNNVDALDGYRTLGAEILAQVGDTPIDVFCAAVGTAGMLVGVSRALRAAGAGRGVRAGTSAALSLLGALELGEGRTVVTVAADSGLKYLAGDLYADERDPL